ncbi:hypothetical protein AU378_02160 [Chryseobacterium kwangjuense]|uniref:Uncharacterized protein n=2 Tax=Chryseobacterium kwangjuense TaxID=267125 RepID=A0A135WI94_9FLAO|nr:hypothetical protein AU378_02160 [Chryseobacterium kwangjuense]
MESKGSAEVTVQLCGVMVTYFNAAGDPTEQRWFTSDQPTLAACQTYQDGVIADLKRQGYRVEKAPVEISDDVN